MREAAEFTAAAVRGLWTASGLIGWQRTPSGYRAQIDIEGTAEEAACRLELIAPEQSWPAGSLSIIWKGQRVRGFDLDGPAHVDWQGRSVPTPHRIWYDDHDRECLDPMDLQLEAVGGWQDATRWFVRWCGVDWSSGWLDPPLQGSLRPMRARPTRSRRRHRSR